VASRADIWRQRIQRGQSRLASRQDPRARLLERVVGAPSTEFRQWLEQPLAAAAVLVGLIERPGGPVVLLTERAAHLTHHPGQISFPGGSQNADETLVDAALREAAEEVGLARSQASLLGTLPTQMTGTGFSVAPVIALLADDFEPVADPAEVATVFELPLAPIAMPGNRQRTAHERRGTRFESEEFTWMHYRIWGATAHILVDLLEVINE
jgi:8-oxo-dGTP pyrophosphatase MutT (NUDIX family)